ncbi:MAG: branched-chain amino acid ABC transporter permease [Rhodospirillaceae bacterium]|jgi:branched-chain amino acid transport system permease protein|nr:branched-chain amino acid ABC transporter permease [Rhodospirillaceae bacterium]MBT5243833.1 branched-chain amino acid ABC transporter permease [Rhodospirillaceae bacterium]MBT5562882.1 branched-chain amino acid ABC transporter permease [Rhodospirillaceae bacterium]MBT6241281.1 branched-chain amino acid ABC transporter permease [Rhodospirillaceae bacterium]MBT7137125.1 branched-chain amino acid ABC transporter permease [Rhodospirillaceae bacterium]
MDFVTFLIQVLNGVQYGFTLFLVASGLTLIFGIMGIINLAHGAFYMIGAYICFWLFGITDSLLIAIMAGIPIMFVFGYAIERLAISVLYKRDHLYQVLMTYGLILILNEMQKILWGSDFYSVPIPEVLSGSIPMGNQEYPVYRLFVSLVCMVVAAGMYVVIGKTKLGMMIRAGASNREMAQALGINISRVFAVVFSLGAALAGFSGMIDAPLSSVYPGMGNYILIISFVVIVIGGIGSVKGAFVGAMLVGLADTFGKVLVPEFSSMVIYALMALVLLWRPQGLFGRAT